MMVYGQCWNGLPCLREVVLQEPWDSDQHGYFAVESSSSSRTMGLGTHLADGRVATCFDMHSLLTAIKLMR
jgi:hypothetical protein